MGARLVTAVVAMVASLALAACGGGAASPTVTLSVYPPAERATAPEVVGDVLGKTERYALADHKGSVVVINFWASWCGPCRAEITDLEAAYQATKANGVAFLGIATRDEKDKALGFIEGRTSYPSIFDPTGKVALGFTDVPPNTIPATLLVDKQGRIAAVIRRIVTRADLDPLIGQLVAERG